MRYGTQHEEQDLKDRFWGGMLAVRLIPAFVIGLCCISCMGCFSDAPSKPASDLQMVAQAEWAFACAKLGVNTKQAGPPSAETVPSPLGVPGGESLTSPKIASSDHGTSPDEAGAVSTRPVICAYAPAWSKESQEFLEWYETSADVIESLPFVIEIVPDEQIPEGLKQYPAFTCGDKGTLGWTDIETLQAELLGDSDGTP